ncbi:MAG TPA: nuclear transport factor 2 family protein [Humibacter sp.]|nr:nuclear transport factor 2 family protein [Humibacter sp.]
MTTPDPEKFANDWLAAWNAHDIESVLAHFADDVVFSSPLAAALVPDCDGVLRGKDAVRAYWQEGLRRIPDLHFELIGVYGGMDAIVINYRNQRGGLVSEVLVFDNGSVTSGHGTYLSVGDPVVRANTTNG